MSCLGPIFLGWVASSGSRPQEGLLWPAGKILLNPQKLDVRSVRENKNGLRLNSE